MSTLRLPFELAKKFNAEIFYVKCIQQNVSKFVIFQTKSEKIKSELLVSDAKDSLLEIEKIARHSDIKLKTDVHLVESVTDYIMSQIKSQKIDLLIADSTPPDEIGIEDHKDSINRLYKLVSCPILTLK